MRRECFSHNDLPHGEEAEKAILGAIILDNSLIAQAVELLKPSDFYVPSHWRIFLAMTALFERGSEINPILIAEELRKDNSLDASGGVLFLTNLTYGLPHVTSIAQYAKLITGKTLLRRILKLADKTVADVIEAADDPEIILASVQQQVEEIANHTGKTGLHLPCYGEFMSQVTEDEEIVALESCRGELVEVQSITNKGKSTFIRNLSFCLTSGRGFEPFVFGIPRKVLLVNFEGSRGRFQSDLRVMEKVFDDAERNLIQQNLFPLHAPEFNDEPLSLSRHMRVFESKAKTVKPDVIIIDTATAAFNIEAESDNAEIASLMKRLIRLARRLNCVVVILHHIGKARAEDGHAREAAHRGRGASAFADFASAIFNLDCDSASDLVTVTCAKRKSGTGENYETTIKLDRKTRWFSSTNESAPRPVTNREQVLRVLAQSGVALRTAGVEQLLAGKMSERTVRNCLAELVSDGLATQPKRGYWQIRNHDNELGNSGNGHRELPNCLMNDNHNEHSDLERLGKLGNPLYELPGLPNRGLPITTEWPPDSDESLEAEAIRAEACGEML